VPYYLHVAYSYVNIIKNSPNEWQVIRSTKREKIHRTQYNIPETKIETNNRIGLLTNETNENSIDVNPCSTKIHKPPPLFIHGVINYGEMIKRITDTEEDEQYCKNCLAKNFIKINSLTPETYRKLVRYFQGNDIFYNTYQLKDERTYRIVNKYLSTLLNKY